VDLLHAIQTYGYLALFIGTFFEGETALLIAGVAAAQGYMDLRWMMVSAFLGSVAGDQLLFLIGRYKSDWFLAKFPRWRQRLQRFLNVVERHSHLLIFVFRFTYGLRNLSSFAIGMTRISLWVYVPLNFAAAAIWVFCFGMVGNSFGAVILPVILKARHCRLIVLGLVCVTGLVFWLYRKRRSRRASQQNAAFHAQKELSDFPGSQTNQSRHEPALSHCAGREA